MAVALKPKDQTKLVQTGYAIQPVLNPDNLTGLEPEAEVPVVKAEEKTSGRDSGASDVAAVFRREVDEAAKLFENRQAPASPAQPVVTAPAAKLPPLASKDENLLLGRANEMMRRGDITGARLLFEHLANRDSGVAAFALAQSFDANYLRKLPVRGLSPDQTRADYWYRRAGELGSKPKR